MKDTDVGSISSAHCMTADLVLAVSVTIVPGFRCGAMSRNIVCIAITGVANDSAPVRKSVAWLESKQREDGGWGETGDSYYPERTEQSLTILSTPSQTAWAVLALLAVGEVNSQAVRRGVNFLLNAQRFGAKWDETEYTAVGFPRVFYLRYHGYSAYFPLWALARYRAMKDLNHPQILYGM